MLKVSTPSSRPLYITPKLLFKYPTPSPLRWDNSQTQVLHHVLEVLHVTELSSLLWKLAQQHALYWLPSSAGITFLLSCRSMHFSNKLPGLAFLCESLLLGKLKLRHPTIIFHFYKFYMMTFQSAYFPPYCSICSLWFQFLPLQFYFRLSPFIASFCW